MRNREGLCELDRLQGQGGGSRSQPFREFDDSANRVRDTEMERERQTETRQTDTDKDRSK